MILYGYWRSSASYRVRLALHFKQLDFEYRSVHLVKDGGEQHQPSYRQLNPAGLVPCLVVDDFVLNQSMAIIDYLERLYPEGASLWPVEIEKRAIAMAIAHDLASDLQPITNLRVLQHISDESKGFSADKVAWIEHWVSKTFSALETRLSTTAGLYCVGNSFSIADVCLLPQVYNAQRFNLELTNYPIIQRITGHCESLDFVKAAYPDNQTDATG